MCIINGRRIPSSQISIRSYSLATGDYSIQYSKNNKDVRKEYKLNLCQPCTFSIDVLVPYELDVFDNRGIETQIWTNLCDKFSSTGRWHSIPARRIEIRKELRGRVHSFAVSVIPIRCGVFEFTARTRAPKSGDTSWIWASPYERNEVLHIIRTASQHLHLSQGIVRQLAQWFDEILMRWYVLDLHHQGNAHPHRNALTAYTSVYLSMIAYQKGTALDICKTMSYVLSEDEWLSNKNNTLRVLSWCLGSSYQVTSLVSGIQQYILVPFMQDSFRRIQFNSVEFNHPISTYLLDLLTVDTIDSSSCSRLSSIIDNSNQNDVLIELVLAFVKSHSLHFFPQSFYSKLLLIMSSSISQLSRFYIHRIFLCLYEKEKRKTSHDKSNVTLSIIEVLESYIENTLQGQQYQIQHEVELPVEETIDGGPIASLLLLIRLLFTTQQNMSDITCLEDQLLITPYLLQILSHMSDEHPDFLRVKELILCLACQASDLLFFVTKRLLALKMDYSNNHTVVLSMLEQLLTSFPLLYSSNLSLLNRVFRYCVNCLHSENIYIVLRSLQFFELESKDSIWRLFLLCDPSILNRFSEFLEEDEVHWFSHIRETSQHIYNLLESKGIVKNGVNLIFYHKQVFNLDAYSSSFVEVRFKRTNLYVNHYFE